MNGILVVNHFLKTEKFETLHSHLQKSAKGKGINLKIVSNQEMLFNEEKPDFVLFWDKDTFLAKALENKGLKVFNSAKVIAICDDKAKTYLALDGIVKQPKTIIAPLSFFDADFSTFVTMAVEKLGLPVVMKENKGSFGEQVYLCNSVDDVLSHINGKPFLLQEYIECNNSDIRLEVVGNKVVAGMKRSNKNDFRSNITNGGTAENYVPTEAEKALAIKACKTLGLDFGGVDIMNGDTVCEVNSNAHIINLMNTTGVDIAPLIFEEILRNIWNQF